MVDDLSDFSKGLAFECFHCYKQAHANSLVYSLFLFILISFLFIVYFCMYVFFPLMLPCW